MNRHTYDRDSGKITPAPSTPAAAASIARWVEHDREQEAKRKAAWEARNARPTITIAELISLLSSMPMDAPVVVDGLADVLGARMERTHDGKDVAALATKGHR